MKAPVASKTQGKLIPLELPAELRLDLAVFCKRHFDAPMVAVIRKALQIFLDEQQRTDSEYDQLLTTDRQARLSVVRSDTDKFTPKE